MIKIKQHRQFNGLIKSCTVSKIPSGRYYMYSKITKLSEGQKQRVAIARALVGNGDIILADEPTGALDQATGKEIMEILKKLNQEGKTIIIVTHDPNVAKQCHKHFIIVDGILHEAV